jgi:hypothetical protein
MKAFIIDRYGSGARLRPGEMPDPVIREDCLPLILGNDVRSPS